MGGTQLLPPLIGLDHARDLIYSARIVTGVEAAALGLVTAVFDDPLSAAKGYAREIAARNPQAIRNAKALTAAAAQVVPANLLAERTAMRATSGSPNQVEAVRARIEHRSPHFED